MGMLSSWPVMAISHHFLVRFAFAASGYNNLKHAQYSLLGDDLTLVSHRVAKVYLHLISCLGMEYSVDKTYISKGVAEFAKSLFCQGEELTPFPLALLRFSNNTLVSNTLAILTECKRRKIRLRSSTLVGLYPKRWRKTVLLAALSPTSPNSVLDLHSRKDFWIFQQFYLKRKIEYFSRHKTVEDSIYAFFTRDPMNFDKEGKLCQSLGVSNTPFIQIALDNGNSYLVPRIEEDLLPLMMIGSNWISYSTEAFPDGLPDISDKSLVPGPS